MIKRLNRLNTRFMLNNQFMLNTRSIINTRFIIKYRVLCLTDKILQKLHFEINPLTMMRCIYSTIRLDFCTRTAFFCFYKDVIPIAQTYSLKCFCEADDVDRTI